jgi:hypothetical protein
LKPAWNQSFDVQPLETMAAKKCLLEHAAKEGWWVSFDHDHRVACGRLGPDWADRAEVESARPVA